MCNFQPLPHLQSSLRKEVLSETIFVQIRLRRKKKSKWRFLELWGATMSIVDIKGAILELYAAILELFAAILELFRALWSFLELVLPV